MRGLTLSLSIWKKDELADRGVCVLAQTPVRACVCMCVCVCVCATTASFGTTSEREETFTEAYRTQISKSQQVETEYLSAIDEMRLNEEWEEANADAVCSYIEDVLKL